MTSTPSSVPSIDPLPPNSDAPPITITVIASSSSPYARSGLDRGHMMPGGDMPDAQSQQQTFSLANMVPQAPALNRDPWERIESATRRLARRQGELYVVTGPAFTGTRVNTIGDKRVLVPTATWKAIHNPRALAAGAWSE